MCGGQGFGGMGSYNGGGGYGQRSPFGSNPMQTRTWMQDSGYRTGGADYATSPDGLVPDPQPNFPQNPVINTFPPGGTIPNHLQNPWDRGIMPGYPQNPVINTFPPGGTIPNHLQNPWDRGVMPGGAQAQPRTGGEFSVSGPQFQPYGGQQPFTGGQFTQQAPLLQPAQPKPAAVPQSWEQQNAQLIRPQQMQDPGAIQQRGGPSLQSQYPGLTPQQLANVNRIGADPVGGGWALNNYLLSIGYPGALQPGQTTIR